MHKLTAARAQVLVLNADSNNCVLFRCEPKSGALTQTDVEFTFDGPTVVKWVASGAAKL